MCTRVHGASPWAADKGPREAYCPWPHVHCHSPVFLCIEQIKVGSSPSPDPEEVRALTLVEGGRRRGGLPGGGRKVLGLMGAVAQGGSLPLLGSSRWVPRSRLPFRGQPLYLGLGLG